MKTGQIAAILAVVAASGCGSLIDSQDPGASGTIGAAGGTVVAGAASVAVPKGALASSTHISIATVPLPAPLPEGVQLAGKVYAVTPHGLQFSSPVTLTLPAPTAHGNYIVITLANPQASIWENVPDAQFSGSAATVQVAHFSFYAIGELAADCSDHNGGCNTYATCSAQNGAVTCTCDVGYEGDGLVCDNTAAADAAFCAAQGANCGTIARTDPWGTVHEASCGTCSGLDSCGAAQPNVCGCVGETDAELCTNGDYCGEPTVTDRCGQTRTPTCSGCATGQTCSCPSSLESGQHCVLSDGSVVAGEAAQNQCVCVSESDAAFCGDSLCITIAGMDNCGQFRVVDCQAANGVTHDACEMDPAYVCAGMCGQVSGVTSDGAATGPFDCGGCPENQTCGAITPNVCGCAPETDAQICTNAGAQCGTVTIAADNCGQPRVATCSSCPGDAQCQGNQCQCVSETPQQLCASVSAQCGTLVNVPDNCGRLQTVASCGSCANGTCGMNAPPNQCPCVPESDRQLCTNAGASCGQLTAVNNCGTLTTVADCGDCASGATCGATTPNVCGCVGESDAQLCAENGAQCGSLVVTDNCGTTKTVTCPDTCTGCGMTTANQCPCVPWTDGEFCAENGAECGPLSGIDNCGATRTDVDCGTCVDGSCGLSQANQCSCSAWSVEKLCESAGARCGPLTATDNCGVLRSVYCGSCPGSTCQDNQCLCVPESTDALCDSAGAQCGILASVVDNCGQTHTNVDCGSCEQGTCGVPKANVCSCVDEDPATFCARAGAQCGSLTGPDNCGNTMTVQDCGSCGWPSTCDEATNACSCIPELDDQLCADHGAQCGTLTAPDNCHVTRTVQCGSCPEPGDTCGAYWPNFCSCVPESITQFCAAQGATCGWVTGNNNCGFAVTLYCGDCWDAGSPADGGAATFDGGQQSDGGGQAGWGSDAGWTDGDDADGGSQDGGIWTGVQPPWH